MAQFLSKFQKALLIAIVGCTGCSPKPKIIPVRPVIMPAMSNTPSELTIGYTSNILSAPAVIGVDSGVFQKAMGPQVVVKKAFYTDSQSAIHAIFNGESNVMIMDLATAYSGYQRSMGNGFKVVAGVGSSRSGLLINGSKGNFNPSSLRSAKIGIIYSTSMDETVLRQYLHKSGLKAIDNNGTVSIQRVNPEDVQVLLDRKEIDAAFLPEPWLTHYEKNGRGNYISFATRIAPEMVLAINYGFLQFHPLVVQKFLIAYIKQIDDMKHSNAEMSDLLAKGLTGNGTSTLSSSEIANALRNTSFGIEIDDNKRKSLLHSTEEFGVVRVNPAANSSFVTLTSLNNALAKIRMPTVH